MTVHRLDKRFGTLGFGKNRVGRIACIRDPYQRLKLLPVTYLWKKVTCKRCLKVRPKGEAGK